MHKLRDLSRGRGQAFSWCQDIRKIEARNVRQIRAFGATEGKAADRAQRARGRLPRSTAAGDDKLRNRIEPMHGQRRTLQKRLERQPASAVTTSPSGCWLDMRVGSPEDCYRDPPVVPQPPTSSATEESEGAPPLTAGLAAHRPTKHPLEHLYKYKYKGDLLQVVNAPGGSGKTLALATLLAEQEEIRSRSATWQLVEGLGSCDPPE